MFNPFPNRNQQMPNGQFNPLTKMQEFKQFVQDFQGDPQQKVQQMLNSGQMTQEQFNQLNNMWNMFGQFFK